MPRNSRMAGALVKPRRSAARVSAVETPDFRNATISVSAVIEPIDGKLAGSNGSCTAALIPGCTVAASTSIKTASACCAVVFASCFNRTQRRKTLPFSVTAHSLFPIRKLLSIALALDKGTVDMMLGNELADHFCDVGRYGHLFNQIVASFGQSFALS